VSSPLAPVGIFDSGVGGLTVARAIIDQLPDEEIIYVGDTANGPYGPLTIPEIRGHALAIGDDLVGRGVKALVIACNTASSACLRDARERYAPVPVVEVILPAVRRAVAATRNGRIGVMATPATLASEKFQALMRAQPAGVTIVPRPCPGLARLIEAGDLDAPVLLAAIDEHAAALRAAGVDTVVLGCTHYPFVRHHIERAMGAQVQLVDTADAVARHATRLLRDRLPSVTAATVQLHTTGDVDRLRRIAAAWLPFDCSVEQIASAAPIA
jgi:glutamate racemase